MLVHYSADDTGIRDAIVTTGSFDGVHAGHRCILRRITSLAASASMQSVLVTFYPHPRKVLYPQTQGRELLMINSQSEKIKLLKETGLDHLLILPFTLEFSRMSSIDFIRNILVKKLAVKQVVVGFNHFFGHNRQGDFDLLREMGRFYQFTVEEIPEQDIQHETVSSTKIRKALIEGNIQRANAYLEHPYFMMGEMKPYNLPGFGEGFYKLEIQEEDKLIPPSGAYAVAILGESSRLKGVSYIHQFNGSNCILLKLTTILPPGQHFVEVHFHKWLHAAFTVEGYVEEVQATKDIQLVSDLIY